MTGAAVRCNTRKPETVKKISKRKKKNSTIGTQLNISSSNFKAKKKKLTLHNALFPLCVCVCARARERVHVKNGYQFHFIL